MLTALENKSITTTAPDIATLRARLAQLRADEARLEKELHAAKDDLTAAEAGINSTLYASSKGNETREEMTRWLFAQSAAQNKILVSIEGLTKARPEIRSTIEAIALAEAHQAAQEAAVFESEVIDELRAFAPESVAFLQRCQNIQALRDRAQGFKHSLFTPGVLEALYPNWGEVFNAGAVESRLALIGKIAELPQAAAEYLYPILRDRARTARADSEREERCRREFDAQKRGAKQPTIIDSFEMEYVVGVGLVTTRDESLWGRGRR